jgi:DNA-binding CsgD family transcriptional regulator
VRHHLRNAYKKLGVSNKGQVLRTLNRHDLKGGLPILPMHR